MNRVGVLVPLSLMACQYGRSEVVVDVVTDIDRGPGATLQAVLVEVRSDGPNGASRLRNVVPLTALGTGLQELFTFGVSPLSGDAGRTVYVELRGCGDAGCEDPSRVVVTQRALFSFVAGERRALTMILADRCRGASCTTSQRCLPETGLCTESRVNVQELPPVGSFDAGAAIDRGMDGGADAIDAPANDLQVTDARVDTPADDSDGADAPSDAHDAGDAPEIEVQDAPIVPPDAEPCADGGSVCGAACVDLASDARNCGACGAVCLLPGASARCTAGACALAVCNGGFGNCDRLEANGCEVDLQSAVNHCGACSVACAFDHASATCVGGTCALGACNAGFSDCDSTAANGCETNLNTSAANCGACGRACTAPANSTAICADGTCAVNCNAGYALSGSACVLVPAPRPLAPLSTATVTSQRPTLRWALTGVADGAHVQICRDRACTTVEQTLDATGTSVAPTITLAAGVHFWRLAGRRGSATGTALGPTWEFFVGARSASRDASWGTVPDFNGDGYADVVVGADAYSGNTGRVYGYYGAAGGLPTAPSVRITGPGSPTTYFGSIVASAGDVNGDGFVDLVVGDYPRRTSVNTGHVYIYHGSSGGLSTSSSVTLNAPDGLTTWFGVAASGAGDINGDGYADIVVGASRYSGGVGRAYIYYGSATGLPTGPSFSLTGVGGSGFGGTVAGLGDVNGDSYADLIVGANSLGNTYIYYGTPVGLPATSSLVLHGMDGGYFGTSITSPGDFNGDGLADFAISAPTANRVYIFHGADVELPTPPTRTLVDPDGIPRDFGAALANVSDFNNDGFSDLVASCPGCSGSNAGSAYIFNGSLTGLSATPDRTLRGLSDDSRFGSSLAGAGDVNGDGFADLIVAAPYFNSNVGRAYIFHGSAAGLPMVPTLTLNNPLGTPDQYGVSVAILDDGARSAPVPWFIAVTVLANSRRGLANYL